MAAAPSKGVASGSLLFDKEKRTLIGFYREQDVRFSGWLPLAEVSEALIRLVDAKGPSHRKTGSQPMGSPQNVLSRMDVPLRCRRDFRIPTPS